MEMGFGTLRKDSKKMVKFCKQNEIDHFKN